MDGAQAMIGTAGVERTGTLSVVFRHIAGWSLILLGLVGLVLPIMPGFLFILPGLGLIAPEIPWAKRTLEWSKEKLTRRKTAGSQK